MMQYFQRLFGKTSAPVSIRGPLGLHLNAGFTRDTLAFSYMLIGSWIIDDEASGMRIREDNTLITKDTSRFVPHYIAG